MERKLYTRNKVDFTLGNKTAYYEALILLVNRYGNKYVLASAFRNKLSEWAKVVYHISLRSDFTEQCLFKKKCYDSLHILYDEAEHSMLPKITRKFCITVYVNRIVN